LQPVRAVALGKSSVGRDIVLPAMQSVAELDTIVTQASFATIRVTSAATQGTSFVA
jgi:hypothetical protein